ncbi:swi5-dependent recombination DNA repair protein 1 homolog [Corythoichthys intestinalis]|uniref:swi5-dependent recombination DNA repair protein 1 homolog n=1 Tax=Corythoichthys intestinalis TaxID=161448 RepID=UPI0025A5862D|nr:swi5-dependent recombination DNA repair protein 1 homolog [Corythoichthys intestinalis]XP_061793932.1 swi5-dependent recombination DNA repair protein 1 homolog [Nerophis lumbriciformis]
MELTPKYVTLESVYSSPATHCGPNETPHQKLSNSLKERLKRTRRSFTSPFSVAKRLCVDEDDGQPVASQSRMTNDDGNKNSPLISQSTDADGREARLGSEIFSGMNPGPAHTDPKDFAQRQERLSREVKDKTETLRRLRMVKMYRSKNNLAQLQTLIDKWRRCAQNALYELQSAIPVEGRKASLSELIDLFGLDENILHFDRAEDDFAS